MILIWRNGTTADAFEKAWERFGQPAAMHRRTDRIQPRNCILATQEQFDQFFRARATTALSPAEGIVILCELNWNKKGVGDFYGLEIAQVLRRLGVNNPVLFVSHFTREDIFNCNPVHRLITCVGHAFLALPSTPADWQCELQSMQPLTRLELTDIQMFFCGKEALLRELRHQIKNLQGDNGSNPARNSMALTRFLLDALNIIQQQQVDDEASSRLVDLHFRSAAPHLDKQSLLALVDEADHVLAEILHNWEEQHAPAPGSFRKRAKRPWKVLLLDDQPENDKLRRLREQLQSYVEAVCVASTAAEAAHHVVRDWQDEDSIRVIIADYRLMVYDPELNDLVQQPVQGYEFLNRAGKTDHPAALAALSGLPRQFLIDTFKHYRTLRDVFSKLDYLQNTETINLLCERIIEMGDEAEEVLLSMPDNAGWRNHLQEVYLQYRSDQKKYQDNEQAVREAVEQYINGFNHQTGSFETSIECPRGVIGKGDVAKFKDYLVARRVVIWLLNRYPGLSSEELIARMHLKDKKGQKLSNTSMRSILSQVLGLGLNDYPHKILVEEKRWLEKMGLHRFVDLGNFQNLHREYQALADVYASIAGQTSTIEYKWVTQGLAFSDEAALNAFIQMLPQRQVPVRKRKFAVGSYKNAAWSVLMNGTKPVIRSLNDARVFFQILVEALKNDDLLRQNMERAMDGFIKTLPGHSVLRSYLSRARYTLKSEDSIIAEAATTYSKLFRTVNFAGSVKDAEQLLHEYKQVLLKYWPGKVTVVTPASIGLRLYKEPLFTLFETCTSAHDALFSSVTDDNLMPQAAWSHFIERVYDRYAYDKRFSYQGGKDDTRR